ncbi:hypothetical protein [Actinomadura nitritigenes]|uniref:hypothetical protein n=1 Tax=Actinomadura nitritigenes TaxID=134602 RepID=UPI003D922CDE
MAFRIAQGFVEVVSRFSDSEIRRGAQQVGRRAGQAFSNTFGREADNGFGSTRRRMESAFNQAGRIGRRAGQAFGSGFSRDSQSWFRASGRFFTSQAQRIGRDTGRRFGQAFSRSAEAALVRTRLLFTQIFRRAGRESGEEAGRQFGEGFFRDSQGRLRDSRGRFARMFRGSGRESGSGFTSEFSNAVRSQSTGILSSFTGLFTSIGSKAKPLIIAGVIAGLAALPAIGALAATGLTAAFGAGIVGIGIYAAAQSDRVKKAFSGLGDHVGSTLKRIATPFQGTLVAIAGQLKGLFDALAPHLGKAFKLLAPVVELFAGRFLGALKAFGPVIDVAAQGFAALLDPLGKQLQPAIKGVADALGDMFATVRDTPELQGFFASFVSGAFDTIAALIRVVTWLAKTYVWFGHLKDEVLASPIVQKAQQIGGALSSAFSGFVKDQAPKVVGKAREVGSAISSAFDRAKAGAPKLRSIFAGVAPGFDGIGSHLRDLGAAVADRVSDIAGKIRKLVGTIGEQFREFRDKHAKEFEQAGQKLSEIGRKLGEALKSAIDVITTVVNRLGSVLGFLFDVITAVWQRFGGNIFGIIQTVFMTILEVVSGALTTLKGVFDLFVGIFTGDWGKAWTGVKEIFSGLWQGILGVLKGALGLVVETVKATVSLIIWPFQWLYDQIIGHSIIPDLVNGILGWFKNLLSWLLSPLTGLRDFVVRMFTNAKDWVLSRLSSLYQGAVSRFTTLRDRATALAANVRDWVASRIANLRDRVVSYVTSLYQTAVSRFTSLRDSATSRMSSLRDWVVSRAADLKNRVVSLFNSLKSNTITAFERAASGVRTAFGKLRSAASAPVRFAIDVVYNQGLVPLWNNIAGKVPGIPGLHRMGIPKGFAKGGITDARGGAALSGYSSRDDQLAMVRSGEGVIVPEAVSALGPGFIHAANRLKGRAAELLGIPAFAGGGVVGAVSGFLGKAKNFFVGGFVKALTSALNPIVGALTSRFGTRNDFPGIPGKMLTYGRDKIIDFMKKFAPQLEGGDGKKVVKVAEKYVGLSGNPNKFTRRMGMNGLPWCGMFVDGVFDEAGASKALRGVSNPALVASYRALPTVSQSQKKAGDLALYRGDAGHINIYTGKGAVTIGGNESNAVHRNDGYINSASSLRRPHFADGGIVDNFIWQDDAESDWFQTAKRTRHLRDAAAAPPWTPGGTHDIGGLLPDDGIAVNRSGQAEVVHTLDQLRAIVEAAKGQQITYVFEAGSIVLDASSISSIQDLITMIENMRKTARQYGAKVTAR